MFSLSCPSHPASHFHANPDAVAAVLSGACVLHCMALPLLLMWIGLDGTLMHGPMWIHWALLATALPVSFFALVRGFSHHHLPGAFLLATIGFLIMALGAAQHGKGLETTLSVGGSLLVAAAHYVNWRTRRQQDKRLRPLLADSSAPQTP